jgi:hypothetical protein
MQAKLDFKNTRELGAAFGQHLHSALSVLPKNAAMGTCDIEPLFRRFRWVIDQLCVAALCRISHCAVFLLWLVRGSDVCAPNVWCNGQRVRIQLGRPV